MKFYNEREVARLISKNGVPKNKVAVEAMVTAGMAGSSVTITQDLIDCLNHVTFAVHPQQINIRDKTNGKIIACIRR